MGEKWRIFGWFFEPELKKWGRMGLETGIEGGGKTWSVGVMDYWVEMARQRRDVMEYGGME